MTRVFGLMICSGDLFGAMSPQKNSWAEPSFFVLKNQLFERGVAFGG